MTQNYKLFLQDRASEKTLIELGFTKENDGTDHPIGEEWAIENDRFRLSIDCWLDAKLQRKDDDAEFADPICLKVESIDDLKEAIYFIK